MAVLKLERELAVAERLAREAGAIIMRYAGSGIAVEYKDDDGGPVTQADREASELVVEGLSRAFPGDGILSEERPDDGLWRGRERAWMIDPLDGTRDFIHGRSGFSVMIGLCVADRPALGVVFQPTTGTLYRAALGNGAERVFSDGRTERMAVSPSRDPNAIRLVASASHRTEAIDRVRAVLGVTDEMNVGSVGLKLALIAQGDRDLYVNPNSKSSLWDSAAPEAILVEAGGILSDLAGRPLDYRGPELRNLRGLVASTKSLHALVLSRLADLFPGGRVDG